MKKILLIFIFVLLSACNGDSTTPEDQVKEVISSIENGVEKRSLSKITKQIDENYLDHKGRTKQEVARYLHLLLFRHQNITVFSRIKSLDINKNIASVELSAFTAAKGTNLSIESNRLKADTINASLVLKNSSGAWKVISASWDNDL